MNIILTTFTHFPSYILDVIIIGVRQSTQKKPNTCRKYHVQWYRVPFIKTV